MPKEHRVRTTVHGSSAKSARRQVVQDTEIQDSPGISATPLEAADAEAGGAAEEPRVPLKKKEKQQLKRQAFMQRLELTHAPYSKSHARREKRKAKEQIAGGLSDMQAALIAVDDDGDVEVQSTPANEDTEEQSRKPKPKPGQIGEGKGATLSKAQRKRALQTERLRHPLILSNPDFSSNPFATIRIHAQNTLLKHQLPT